MRRLLPLLLLTLACTSFQRQSIPGPGDEALQAREARITRNDGSVHSLINVRVDGDSLTGFTSSNAARVAIATSDISTIEIRQTSEKRTAGLITGIVVGAGAALVGLLVLAGPGMCC